MLKVNRIIIENINGIKDLELNFNKGFNFISGSNGVGKTTVVDCIASTFNRNIKTIRPHIDAYKGNIEIEVYNNNIESKRFSITKSSNNEVVKFKNSIRSKEIVNFSINRTTSFKLYYRNTSDSIQEWFYKNYYKSKNLSEKSFRNLQIAKECFSRLDCNLEFSKVEERQWNEKHSSHLVNSPVLADIILKTTRGEIPFDYLSSGYKSCLILLLTLIKNTEVTSGTKDVHSFEGVILIDEIDLHLHPKWQGKLIEIFRWLVPNAQIIATTHSPHIIQMAFPDEVIALGISEEGQVFRREVASSEYGFQGWSVEEILGDVMGMEDTFSQLYVSELVEFETALSEDDKEAAVSAFKNLDKMLHPQNHLRKILKIQMAPMGRRE